jgi:ribosome-associated toxin RatA of RatAB toxin-antitoxin module
MKSVTVSRHFDASPDAVHELIHDVEAFMRAGGFDEVVVEDNRIGLTNRVGIATIELQLEIFAEDDTALSYRQHEGIFEEMTSKYTLTPTDDGCEVTATTDFAIDVALVGDLMDATIIKRQRRRELEAQFDWFESQLDG